MREAPVRAPREGELPILGLIRLGWLPRVGLLLRPPPLGEGGWPLLGSAAPFLQASRSLLVFQESLLASRPPAPLLRRL